MTRALLATLLCLCAFASPAQERILRYDTTIDVRADGSMDVAEAITVRAEGDAIRRGLYREFPTRYRDRHGNRVVVDFDVVEVLRDGAAEPWFTERMANGVRLNTGDDTFLQVPATYTYTLRYRTSRQLGFFEAHDELYWNAIGPDWAFPIEQATVEVRLPEPVDPARLEAEAYTGPQGGRGQDYTAVIPAPGTARWTLTAPLPPGHGFTIVLSFPKGVVAAPDRGQQARWFLRDNRGVLVALVALLVLVAFCATRWNAVGRDPASGPIIARYVPPEGHTPGGVRYLHRMAADQRGFSADLLALAVAGHLRIHRDDGPGDAWSLERLPAAGDPAEPAQRAMLDALFAGGARLELDPDQAATLQRARSAQSSAYRTRYQPAMFRTHGGSIAIAMLVALVGAGAAFAASGGDGLVGVLALCALMGVVLAVFSLVIKAPTPAGRRLMDEIEGLKRYLGVAEREALAALPAPGGPAPRIDAGRYEALLPYAVALEVEDAWTEQFTRAVGVEAATDATRHLGWYSGRALDGPAAFTRALGTLEARVASASTPPGSASGGGGGGFSGGGGGGGGGGGR